MAITISGSNISGWDPTFYGGGSTSTGGLSSASVDPSTGLYTYSIYSGYATLEGGLILQWGQNITTGIYRYSNLVIFPLRFPNAILSLVMSEGGAAGWGFGPEADNYGGTGTVYSPTLVDVTGFGFEGAWTAPVTNYYSANLGMHWYAVGY